LVPIVVIVKVVDVLPAGTVTDAGSVATELELASPIKAPPAPAGPLSVTVPTEGLPPRTEPGFRLNEESTAGEIVSVAL
jgi:hypothetical protein